MSAEPRLIPDSNGMQVLPNIQMLETNTMMDIIIRKQYHMPFFGMLV